MSWNDYDFQMIFAIAIRPLIATGGVMATMVLSLAILAGCGGEKQPQRFALEGTVTLDGEPLTEGNIRFLPAPETDGGMVGAKISEGRFVIPAEKGAVPGKYRVEIGASRKTGRKVPNPMSQQLVDEFVQFLPERYNLQSTLTTEVTVAGPNRFEFALSLR
jgi:hypothetical protein